MREPSRCASSEEDIDGSGNCKYRGRHESRLINVIPSSVTSLKLGSAIRLRDLMRLVRELSWKKNPEAAKHARFLQTLNFTTVDELDEDLQRSLERANTEGWVGDGLYTLLGLIGVGAGPEFLGSL